MMIIGSSYILFSLSASRLPKSGDDPKVQVARSDFGIAGSQVIENKMQRNRETLRTPKRQSAGIEKMAFLLVFRASHAKKGAGWPIGWPSRPGKDRIAAVYFNELVVP
jgi:hypothetical protein